MRKFIFGLVVLLVSAVSTHAQSGDTPNYDFAKPMYTVVDVASKGYFGGWSGDCNSGRIPSAITLWRIDGNQVVRVPATATTGSRPDAAAWLAGTCNRPFDANVGWSLVPNAPEPAGAYTYVVLVTDVPTSWTCGVYPAGFPNAGQQWCDYVANTVYRTVQ